MGGTGGTAVELRILKELQSLKKAQQHSEEQRLLFENRIEKKLHAIQRNRGARGREETVYDEDDFEGLDRNFPITETDVVEQLEKKIRKELEFKFLLVIDSCLASISF